MNTKLCRIYSFFLVCLIALIPFQASAFSVRYDYYVFSDGGSGSGNLPILDNAVLNGQTSIYDAVSMTGSALGNNAMVQFSADLATGGIRAHAYAKGFDDGYTSTARVDQIGFSDTLRFTIPAGTYDNGVTVSLNGRVSGTLSATQFAATTAGYTINFGGNSISLNPNTPGIGVDDTGLNVVDDPFSLSVNLVSPGTTLASAQQVSVSLFANFNGHQAYTTNLLNQSGDYTAIAETDFYNSMQFTSVDTPDGINWISDSGVFLSAVPVPAAVWLFTSGLIGLIGFARRKVRV